MRHTAFKNVRWFVAMGLTAGAIGACDDSDAATGDTGSAETQADTTNGNETSGADAVVGTEVGVAETLSETVAETSAEVSAETGPEDATASDTTATETQAADTVAETSEETSAETAEETVEFDYNMFSQQISIGYDMSGSEPTNCAIAIPMGPIPADAGIRVPIVQFLKSISGATTVDTTNGACGSPEQISCTALFNHDVMARDGALAEVLDPLAQELGGLTTTSVYNIVLHAADADYDAVVLGGRIGDKVVGIAFVAGLPYCGVN